MTLRRVFRLGEGLSGRVSFPALGRKSVAAAPGKCLSGLRVTGRGRGIAGPGRDGWVRQLV